MPILLYLFMLIFAFIFDNCCSNSFESRKTINNTKIHFVEQSYGIDDINDVTMITRMMKS